MRALILVGGFGTRLRPLTLSKPKPLVEFCGIPILEAQVAALAAVGVTEIILAVNYKPEVMQEALKGLEKKYNVKLTTSLETEPMGTGACFLLAWRAGEVVRTQPTTGPCVRARAARRSGR